MQPGFRSTVFLFRIAVVFQSCFLTHLAHADNGEAKLELQNKDHKVNITNLHWDLAKVLVNKPNETKEIGSAATSTITLRGRFLDRIGKSLILMLGDSNSIQIHFEDTDEQVFKVEVPIHSQKTPIQLISISDFGVSLVDDYVLEVDSYGKVSSEVLPSSKFELKRGRISSDLFIGTSPSYVITSMISWNPLYLFKSWIHIQGILGAAPVKSTIRTYYAALEYGLGVSVHTVKGIWVEGAFGGQYWTDAAIHAPFVGGNLVLQLDHKALRLVDQVFLGYSGFFNPNNFISELRLGVGISF